jgi:hypothetical protein
MEVSGKLHSAVEKELRYFMFRRLVGPRAGLDAVEKRKFTNCWKQQFATIQEHAVC